MYATPPVPGASGADTPNPFVAAWPVLVTVSETLIHWPVFTDAGSAVTMAESAAAVSTVVETAATANNGVPPQVSPFADPVNSTGPDPSAVNVQDTLIELPAFS